MKRKSAHLETAFGIVKLKQRSKQLIFDNKTMALPAIRLQSHRRKSGLTQREVATVIGLTSDVQIFRYEMGGAIPPLVIAMSFAVLFRTSIEELFPEVYRSVQSDIETRLKELENHLGQINAKGRAANIVAHKLEWICDRKARDAR